MAIINEKEVVNKEVPLGTEELASYFKLILIGPQTIKANSNILSGVPEKIDGYFITGDSKTLKEALHKIIDIAFEAQEKANG